MMKIQDPKMLHAIPCEGPTSINIKAMAMHHVLAITNHVRKHAILITHLWHLKALTHCLRTIKKVKKQQQQQQRRRK